MNGLLNDGGPAPAAGAAAAAAAAAGRLVRVAGVVGTTTIVGCCTANELKFLSSSINRAISDRCPLAISAANEGLGLYATMIVGVDGAAAAILFYLKTFFTFLLFTLTKRKTRDVVENCQNSQI
jgi:hypothetical protein